MKKLFSFLTVILLFLFLPACQEKDTLLTPDEKADTVLPAQALDRESIESQISWLSQNMPLWYSEDLDDSFSPIGFTVTDLDQDGLLEIITATLQGSGLYTYPAIFEMAPTMDSLVFLSPPEDEFLDFPDILGKEQTPVYYDETSGDYHYIFYDFLRNGAAEYFEFTTSLTLTDDDIVLTPLALRHEQYLYQEDGDEEEPEVTYTALAPGFEDQALSFRDYDAIAETFYRGLSKKQATFLWQMREDFEDHSSPEELYDKLNAAYHGFSLE